MFHSPWEIVDPYPVLVNYNASRHHPNENLCVALVLKRGEKSGKECVSIEEEGSAELRQQGKKKQPRLMKTLIKQKNLFGT